MFNVFFDHGGAVRANLRHAQGRARQNDIEPRTARTPPGARHGLTPSRVGVLGLLANWCSCSCDLTTYEPRNINPEPSCDTRLPGNECRSSLDCTAGTDCFDADEASDASRGRRECRPVYSSSTDSHALITGFASTEFDIRVERGADASFEFEAPEGARLVTCGLFVGAPVVTGGSLGRVANHDRVLFRTHAFNVPQRMLTPSSIRFRVADLSTLHSVARCDAIPFNDFDSAYPVVTTLSVGCWAMDRERVFSASQLVNLSISDLSEVGPPVSSCLNTPDQVLDGRACIPLARVGVCAEGTCLSPEEQDAAPPAPDGGPPEFPVSACSAAADGRACSLTPNFAVGRCVANFCNDQEIEHLERPLVVTSCALQGQRTDWLNCYDARVQGYGTCLEQECRLRCTSAGDCKRVADFTRSSALACFKVDTEKRAICDTEAQSTDRRASELGVCLPREDSQCN